MRIKSCIRWFKRQYFKLWDHHGLMYEHYINGKFRVLYPDGKKSQPMSWRLANDYAEMFGGKVIDNF